MAAKKKAGAKKTAQGLTRCEADKVLGGVAGGLSDFFDIDPTVIRIIFILLTVFGGSGLLLYIVLWIIVPSPKNEGKISEDTMREGANEIKMSAEKFAEKAKGHDKKGGARSFFGLFLLVMGIVFLLDNFGLIRFFNIFKLWPVALIFLAFMILSKNGK